MLYFFNDHFGKQSSFIFLTLCCNANKPLLPPPPISKSGNFGLGKMLFLILIWKLQVCLCIHPCIDNIFNSLVLPCKATYSGMDSPALYGHRYSPNNRKCEAYFAAFYLWNLISFLKCIMVSLKRFIFQMI